MSKWCFVVQELNSKQIRGVYLKKEDAEIKASGLFALYWIKCFISSWPLNDEPNQEGAGE